MKLFSKQGRRNSGHLLNPNAFSDGHAIKAEGIPPPEATPNTTDFGASSVAPLAGGDPKYLQVGKKRNIAKGLTNARFQYN